MSTNALARVAYREAGLGGENEVVRSLDPPPHEARAPRELVPARRCAVSHVLVLRLVKAAELRLLVPFGVVVILAHVEDGVVVVHGFGQRADRDCAHTRDDPGRLVKAT